MKTDRLHMSTSKKAMLGVGMVEVLVALVVLGVGLLGIASLYVTTLKAKTTALSRTQAVVLANDIADRIRANRLAVVAYDTTIAPVANQGCADAAAASVACTPANMASNDLWQWTQQITATLPGTPTGTVIVNTLTAPVTYNITINWTEPSTGNLSYGLVVQI